MAFSTGFFNPYNIGGADQQMSPSSAYNRRDQLIPGHGSYQSPAEVLAQAEMERQNSNQISGGQVPPWQEILAQIMGAGQSSSVSASQSSPYDAVLRDLRRQMGDARAQEAQNQADIGSWFGQLGGMYRGGAKTAKKSTRAAGRDNARFNRGILSGVADPNVARSLARGAQSDSRFITQSGEGQAQFMREMAVDANRQAAYQNLIQQRLGAKERQDIRAQMGQVRAQDLAYDAENQTDPTEGLFKFLQLLPEEARMQFLTQGTLGGADGSGFGVDQATGLADALGGVKSSLLTEVPDPKDPDTKHLEFGVDNFEQLLAAMRHAASANPEIDLSDPKTLAAFRSWIAGNILPQWNNIARNVEGRQQWAPGQGGFYSQGE